MTFGRGAQLAVAFTGVIQVVTALHCLLDPEANSANLGIRYVAKRDSNDLTNSFFALMSIAAINIGLFILMAALFKWAHFPYVAIAARLNSAFLVFVLTRTGIVPGQFLSCAAFEVGFAGVVAAGLVYDGIQASKSPAASPAAKRQ